MRSTSEPSRGGAGWLALDPRPQETLRAALARTLRAAIREGALRPGARLPSSRQLASDVGVSRGVTSDVYAQLEAQGFVVVTERAAPVVADVLAREAAPRQASPAAAAAPRYDMTPTSPDVASFPARQWLAAVNHAGRRAPVRAFGYGDPRGDEGLREVLAEHLGRTRGVIADPARIVVVQGTAQGVDVILRVLMNRGRGRVVVEDPSLPRQHEAIRALGLHPVGAPVDRHGVTVAALDADAALVTPAHQYPTGVVLSGERRRLLLSWAYERDVIVIEDDYDAEFRYDREPVRALQGLDPEQVAYVGTVSKTLAPALRLGWLVAPAQLADEVVSVKRLLDDGSPTLDQLALRRLLDSGEYDRHVRRMRSTYGKRRERLLGALAHHLAPFTVSGIAAGLHALLELPDAIDDQLVADEARRRGLLVEPLSRSALERRDLSGLVVGYGAIHESAIEPATALLAAIVTAASERVT